MINGERLHNHLQQLSLIGRTDKGGINRFSYTAEEKQANELVRTYMEAAGLTVKYDAVGNLIGSQEGSEDLAVIRMGSHLDTVPEGGSYDGSLGVLSAIEAIHSLKENGVSLRHPVEIIAFKDEEGTRFGFGMIGSRAVAGSLKIDDLQRVDESGITIEQAIANYGVEGETFEATQPDKVKLYIEVHIEQGRVLEVENVPVGNVTGIAGTLWLKFSLQGLAEHAGATPMDQRQDALVGASLIIAEIERLAKQYESAVATVGKLTVKPNGVNVIPGEVEWTVDLRDIDEDTRDKLEHDIKQFAETVAESRGLKLHYEELQRMEPVQCDENIQAAIKESILEVGEKVVSLPSGAGHDGMQFKGLFPIGMIFARSKDGISHNPNEFTAAEDIERVTEVLYKTLIKVDQD